MKVTADHIHAGTPTDRQHQPPDIILGGCTQKQMNTVRRYMGINIYRVGINSSGMRWTANAGNGRLLADTLVGIKQLIKEAK